MSKYHNQKVVLDNIIFDSKVEGRRYVELKLLESAGVITGLKVHPQFVIWQVNDGRRRQDRIIYEADFQYTEIGLEREICEDIKGVETAVFKIKEKMFRAAYPDIYFRVIKRI